MNKRLLKYGALLLINLLSPLILLGQSYMPQGQFKRGSEIRLSIGAFPLDGTKDHYRTRTFIFDEPLIDSRIFPNRGYGSLPTFTQYFNTMTHYSGPTYISGAISAGYTYRLGRKFEVSALLTYSGLYKNVFEKATQTLSYHQGYHQVTLMPIVRWVWLNQKNVRLYSSFGLGIGLSFNVINMNEGASVITTNVVPAVQWNYFGITIGDKIYGLFELSAATTGLITAGLGYKF